VGVGEISINQKGIDWGLGFVCLFSLSSSRTGRREAVGSGRVDERWKMTRIQPSDRHRTAADTIPGPPVRQDGPTSLALA
jgi:hypothetical protein